MPLLRTWKTTCGYLIRLKYLRHSPFGLKQLTVRNSTFQRSKRSLLGIFRLDEQSTRLAYLAALGRVFTGELLDQARKEDATRVPVSVQVDEYVLVEL